MPRLSLSLLGPLQVTLDERPVTGFESNKARALLAYLAVEADQSHGRDGLACLLWPEQSDEVARTNLRQALANLRQTIGDRTAELAFLSVTRETVRFNTDSDHWLDVATFTDLLTACEKHVHRHSETCKSCAQRLQQAVELYRGNFLDQFFLNDSAAFEEWALVKREGLRRLALDALHRLADYHERRGAHEQVLRYASRQLELDPWREEAHRQVMLALALSGQRSAALAQYETCRRVLADELHAEPSKETTALYEKIKTESREPEGEQHTSSLPVSITPFIGREDELAEIARLLENPACRLVTLTGPGGIGKTRLALQAATEQVEVFSGGVHFVSLAPLGSVEFLVPAIADVLHLALSGQQDPKAQLLNYLRDLKRDVLLVLDDFEYLLEATGLVAEILQRAPQVTLLVTSRERLNLQGEWAFDIHGLKVPEGEQIEEIKGYSAVELFVQSARRSQTDFSLTEKEKACLVRICRLVEGMPLAIELAAAWVRVLSCQGIAQEIEQSFGFLTTPLRDVPERHRSIRAVFHQSWNFLSEEERHVFRKLSVFRGEFRREAAEQVAGASLPILAALVDKSLVRRSSAGHYDIHVLLRQFAHEKLLESEDVEQTRDRHLAYFLALVEAAEPNLTSSEQKAWFDRLEYEHDNLRVALKRALENGQAELAARFGVALWRFWSLRGYLNEGRQLLEAVLARRDTLPAMVRATVLRAAGALATNQGDYHQARVLLEECLASFRGLGYEQGVADALNSLGHVMMEQEDYAKAKTCYEESLALAQALGHKRAIAAALGNLGLVALLQGDYVQARGLHEECLALARLLGDKQTIAISLCNLGLAALYQGDYVQARAPHEESLVLSWELGDKENIAWCLEGLAGVAGAQGRPVQAARLYGAAEFLRDVIGIPLPLPYQVHYERMLAAARAQLDEAAFATAWAEGRSLSLEQAIADALADDGKARRS